MLGTSFTVRQTLCRMQGRGFAMTELQQCTTGGTSPRDDELAAHRHSVAAVAEATHTARQLHSMLEFHDAKYEWRRLFSELLGTFMLVFVAAGGGIVNAKFGGNNIPQFILVTAPGMMVLSIILFMGAVSGAHLNPGVSLAFALRGDFPWRRVPLYIAAQFVGAILATLVLVALLGKHRHGGALGVAIVVFLFARRHKYSLVNLGDACCMVVPLGLFFGRIANFINGELYGHITNVWWAVKFPTEIANPTNDRIAHYLGTYNERNDFIPGPALKDAVITMGQAVNNLRNQMQLPPLDATRAELVHLFYHPADMLPSSIHADPAQIDQVHNVLRQQFDALLQPRHPSQLYEACLEGLALFAICWLVGRLWKKDGMASSAFLIFYPVMRIIGEQFRVGDTPVLLFGFAVSKGILYSIPMLILGIVYWVYWVRQPPRDSAPGLRLKPDAHA